MLNVKIRISLTFSIPGNFLSQKHRMLHDGWPGLFREHILPTIPMGKVTKYFNETFGRPSKELYGVLGGYSPDT